MKKIKTLIFTLFSILLLPSILKAQTKEEIMSQISPNGVIKVNAIETPININEITESKWANIQAREYLKSKDLLSKAYINCQDLHNCKLQISGETEDFDITLEYTTLELTSNDTTELNDLISKIKTIQTGEKTNRSNSYILEDLEAINAWIINPTKYEDARVAGLQFVTEFTKAFDNSSFTYKVSDGAGGGGTFFGESITDTYIYKNNVMVAVKPTYLNYSTLFYIPSSTPNTKEAYIEAAKKRMNEYLQNNNIEITYGGSLEEDGLASSLQNNSFFDIDKANDNYYYFSLNGVKSKWLIIPSDKLNTPIYEEKDIVTGLVISTIVGDVPLDTTISVEDLTDVTEVLEEVKEQITTQIHKIFDITLYSETKKDNITKLSSGMFKVTIPLGIDYIGKKLKAYYINENKEVEEYEITMDEFGNASFETNHFSKYIIAEASNVDTNVDNNSIDNIEVPKTLDNIKLYIYLSVLSFIVMTSCILYIKNK